MRRSRRRRLTPSGETATTIDVHFWLSVLFIIPSVVEESLTFNRGIVRDVSVRAGLAYSLNMTKQAGRVNDRNVKTFAEKQDGE